MKEKQAGKLKLVVSLEDCSKEAIYQAIYPFLDDYFFSVEFVEKKKKAKLSSLSNKKKRKNIQKQAVILIEPQQGKFTKKKKQEIKKQLQNEILYATIREKISRKNKNVREAIVAQSLLSAVMGADDNYDDLIDPLTETEDKNEKKSNDKEGNSLPSGIEDDPLGIAVPWEEKFGKKEKR